MKQRLPNYNNLQRLLQSTAITVLCLLAFALISTLASCSMMEDSVDDCVDNNNNGEFQGTTYFTIRIATASSDETQSRVGPTYPTNKYSDGTELGFENESNVSNATLFFYEGKKSDLSDDNKASNINIKEAYYFPSFVETTLTGDIDNKRRRVWTSQETKEATFKIPNSNYGILIIVNAGDLSSYVGKSLKEVRDDVIKYAWSPTSSTPGTPIDATVTQTEGVTIDNFNSTNDEKSSNCRKTSFVYNTNVNISNFKNFVMTSEDARNAGAGVAQDEDATQTQESNIGTGTEEDPLILYTEVNRLAARIDFVNRQIKSKLINTRYQHNDTWTYEVYKSDTGDDDTGDRFVLTHVMPFNCMSSGTYFIKRIYDKEKTELSYVADETRKNQAWVVDPLWSAKSQSGFTADATNYTLYDIDNIDWTNSAYAVKPSQYIGKEDEEKGISDEDIDNYLHYYPLTYTQENTSPDNNTAYATGLLFHGKYYKASEWDSNNNKPKDDATGTEKTYKYYIRHIDPNDEYNTSLPMLYGIVRNNIYRVWIDRVVNTATGLEIVPKIQVRKWATYNHAEIVM